MSDLSARTIVSVAVAVGMLFAALSGGAVTYASFTDSGSVDVTVTTGEFTDTSDETTDTESTDATGDDSDDSTTNESENETTEDDSDDSTTNESDDEDDLDDSTTNDSENETTENDTDDSTTNESENETTAEDPEYLSDGLSESGVSTTGEPRLTVIGDQNPEAGETVVDYRRLPGNGL